MITREEWYQYNGFNADGAVWVVLGETFPIKDYLKESGFKYCRELGWHGDHEIEISGKVTLKMFNFDDLAIVESNGFINWREDIFEIIKKSKSESTLSGFSDSDFVGTPSERLKNLLVSVLAIKDFEGMYGYTKIYTFLYGTNILTWFTSSDKVNLKVGDQIKLNGTVKDHREYNGIKQTMLSRCTIKEV